MSFLQLPQELQDRIYRDHYEDAALVVRWNPTLDPIRGSSLAFDPLPSLSIELVCRRVGAHAKKVRDTCWPRTMTVVRSDRPDQESVGLEAVFNCLVQNAERYSWLCNRIEVIIALDVASKYIAYEGCFAWQELLRTTPQLHHFSFHTSHNFTIRSKIEARKFLPNLEAGQHDLLVLGRVHGLGIGDLPEQLQLSDRPDWSVLVLTTACFKSPQGENWFRRFTTFDFRTMAASSSATMIDDPELRAEKVENGQEIT